MMNWIDAKKKEKKMQFNRKVLAGFSAVLVYLSVLSYAKI